MHEANHSTVSSVQTVLRSVSLIAARISTSSGFRPHPKHDIGKRTTEICLTDASIHGYNAVATISAIPAHVGARGPRVAHTPSIKTDLPSHSHSVSYCQALLLFERRLHRLRGFGLPPFFLLRIYLLASFHSLLLTTDYLHHYDLFPATIRDCWSA